MLLRFDYFGVNTDEPPVDLKVGLCRFGWISMSGLTVCCSFWKMLDFSRFSCANKFCCYSSQYSCLVSIRGVYNNELNSLSIFFKWMSLLILRSLMDWRCAGVVFTWLAAVVV